MAEFENNEQVLTPKENDFTREAQTITEMRQQLDNLQAQNADLLLAKQMYYDAVLNGSPLEEAAPQRTRKEIADELFGKEEVSNLQYAKLALELDDACLREEGRSCFLPKGRDATPTVDERELAERFHKVLAECIEEADEDDDSFNSSFNRRIRKK